MFLIRPRPELGESLSSWRQRSALENGFSLFPIAPGELRRSDSDLCVRESTRDWLSRNFDVAESDLDSMTLRSLNGKVLGFGPGRCAPRWVLPLRYSRKTPEVGVPYCACCLSDDAVPYFRLGWRMCLYSHCLKHRVLLQDRCAQCGSACWPTLATRPAHFESHGIAIYTCPRCGSDYRKNGSAALKENVFQPLSGERFDAPVKLSAFLEVPACEYAAAAWCVAQLFIRARSARRIGSLSEDSYELVGRLKREGAKSVEYLSLQARHVLTTATHALFREWPDGIIEFCRSAGLSAEHFSVDRSVLPDWFEQAVRRSLRRQVRGVTVAEVARAQKALEQAASPVNKATVARALGVCNARAVNEMLGRRNRATEQEAEEFLRRLQELQAARWRRRTSREVRLRDSTLLLMAALTQQQLAKAAALDFDAVRAGIDAVVERADVAVPVHRLAVRTLAAFAAAYEDLRRQRATARDVEGGGAYFLKMRGSGSVEVSAQRMLANCLLGMDSRLHRNVAVFAAALAASD